MLVLWIQFFFVHRTTISKDLSRLVRHLSAGLLTAIAFFAVYLRLTDLVYPSQLTSIRTVEPSILSLFFSAEYFRYVLESLPFLPNDFGYIESNWLGQTVSSAVFICIFFAVTFAGLAYESRQIFGTFGRFHLTIIKRFGLFLSAFIAFILAFLFICAAMLAAFDEGDLVLRNSLGRYIAPVTALVLVSLVISSSHIGARVLLLVYLVFFGFRLETLAPLRYDSILPIEVKLAWRDYFDDLQETKTYCRNGNLEIVNKSVFPSIVIEYIGYRVQPDKFCEISVVNQPKGKSFLYFVAKPSRVAFSDFRPWGLSLVKQSDPLL